MNAERVMNKKRKTVNAITKGVVVGALAGLSFAANAEIVGYQGNDSNAQPVKASADKKFTNAKTNLAIAVSTGLERVIRLTVTDSSDRDVFTRTTDIVGGTDRFSFENKQYYGKTIELNSLSDGEYRVTAEILDTAGNVVNTFIETMVKDTTAPVVAGEFYWKIWQIYQRIHTDGKYVVSYPNASDAGYTEVSDALSGIDRVTFKSEYLTGPNAGEVYRENVPGMYTEDGRAIIGTGTQGTINGSHIPGVNAEMRFTFTIFDKAGNATSVSEDVYVANGIASQPEPWAVYTGSGSYDGFTGYEKYVDGMVVSSNPVKMIYRMPASEMRGGNAIGDIYGGWYNRAGPNNTSYFVRENNEHVYFEVEGTSSGAEIQRLQAFITSPRSWRAALFKHDIKFSSDEFKPPVAKGIQAYVEGLGQWVPDYYRIGLDDTNGQPDAITKIKVSVEPRPYVQKYRMRFSREDLFYDNLDCDVQPNEDHCIISTNLPFPGSDINVYHGRYSVSNEAGTLISNELVPNWSYHGDAPRIDDIQYYDAIKRMTIKASGGYPTRVWGQNKLGSAKLRLLEQNSGNEIIIEGAELQSELVNDRIVYDYEFDLTSLPDGVYDATAEVKANFKGTNTGTTVRQLVKSDIAIDATAPTISFNIASGDAIKSLDVIEISVEDSVSDVYFDVARLQGGPNNDDIFLSVRNEGGKYKLEFPVMFPSLSESDVYTLDVAAVDASSNVATKSINFVYNPDRVGLKRGETVYIPAITESITDRDGNGPIATQRFINDDGQPVQGVYQVNATLSSDADYAMVINGVTLQPGETKSVSNAYDFSASDGVLNMPAHPASSTATGTAGIILTPTFPNAPIAYGKVALWAADTSIENYQEFYTLEDKTYEFKLTLDSSLCQRTESSRRTATVDMFSSPRCLIEVGELPENFNYLPMDAKVFGKAINEAETKIPYTVSLLDDSGNKVTIKTGEHTINFVEPEPERLVMDGKIKTDLPSVEIAQSDNNPTSFVEEIQLSLNKDGVYCQLTAESFISTYTAEMSPRCFFEWVSDLKGLSDEGTNATGVLNENGSVEIGYQVSAMEKGEKVPLLTGTYTLEVGEPLPSIVEEVEYVFEGEVVRTRELENYDKKRGVSDVTVRVNERPFDQIVKLKEASCVVPEGQTSCKLELDGYVPGLDAEDIMGKESEVVAVNDALAYLTPTDDVVNFNFDYRPPELIDVIYNKSATEVVTHTIDGVEYEIPAGQAMVVTSTPHSDKAGDWWMPDVREIELVPKHEPNDLNRVSLNGLSFRVRNYQLYSEESYSVRAIDEPQLVGDKTIFLTRISQLPDGIYSTKATISDKFDNMSTMETDETFLDKSGPQLLSAFGGTKIRDGATTELAYFSDLHFLAYSDWNDGSKITKVTLDDQPISFTQNDDGSITIDEVEDAIEGSNYKLVVEASDDSGNKAIEEYNLSYMNTEFVVYPTREEVFAEIMQAEMIIYQKNGQGCTFSATPEAAIEIADQYNKGCTIEIDGMPDGMDLQARGRRMYARGVVDEVGPKELQLKVVYYNEDGLAKTYVGDTVSFEVLPAPPITLTMDDRNHIAGDKYFVPYNSRNAGIVNLKAASGALDIVTAANGNTDVLSLNDGRRAVEFDRNLRVERVDNNDSGVWSEVLYSIDAEYRYKAESKVNETFNAIITPSTRTSAFLVAEMHDETSTDDTVVFSGYVGQYNRRLEVPYEYDATTMGDWDASLMVRDGLDYSKIAGPVNIDENGRVQFEVSGQTLFDEGRTFYLLAKSRSEIEDYALEILSRPSYIEILKAGAIDGTIYTRTLKSQIPFYTTIAFRFDTREDREVIDTLGWELSRDGGTTWESIPDTQDENRFVVQMDEPVTNQYRVRMKNRLTGVESTSNVLEIIGYEISDIQLDGPRTVIRGLDAQYTASISEELKGSSDGVYEWSIDDGQTWVDGTSTFNFNADESGTYNVAVRHRLNSALEVEVDEYSEESTRVVVVDPEKLFLDLDRPRYFEVGRPETLEASYRLFNSRVEANVIERITLPNGDVLNEGGQFTYAPSREDLNDSDATFVYEAWVEGLEEETREVLTVDVHTYDYQFNTPVLDLRQSYPIAPTPVRGQVGVNVENESPDIDYTYQWSVEDGFDAEIQGENSQRSYIVLKDAGLQTVKVNVADNRGNEAEVTQMVNVEEAGQLEASISARFNKSEMTVPLSSSLRLNVEMQHPRDYVREVKWYLNDELVSDVSSDREYIEMTESGTYTVKAIVITDHGQTGESEFTFEAKPNIPPVCEPHVKKDGTSATIYPYCKDEDGRVVRIFMDWGTGEQIRSSGVTLSDYVSEGISSVVIRAIDDGGEEFTTTVVL